MALTSKLMPSIWLLPFLLLLASNTSIHSFVTACPPVPCYFIFGDSMSDVGNNNNLQTLAKVDYSPYGIDFPVGPTGRFSNGRNMQDIIVELLDFETFIPPFATASGREILRGVNYASGSAGILNETGQLAGDRVSMNKQLTNHQTTISTMYKMLGKRTASELLKKCIYAVQIGSNDYINNYFIPIYYNTSQLYTPPQFAEYLIQQYAMQIKTLYDNGGRIFALFGIGSIGCTPNAITTYGTNGSLCFQTMNDDAEMFNQKLISLVDEFNSKLPDAVFTYLNPSGTISANSLGFTVTNASCCEVVSSTGLCIENSNPCSDRAEYVFWDAFHTSDAWNMVIAKQAYTTRSTTQAYPLNIQNLAYLFGKYGGDGACGLDVLIKQDSQYHSVI